MTVKILVGDVLAMLATLADDSVDCVVTSPPYWGLRDYGVEGQIGLERTLGEHLAVMIAVFREVRRVLKPTGTLWLNYGDCYATTPNGRSAADTKTAGNDDRTFRDKPFSTIGGVLKPKDLCMVPNRLAIALQEDGWWVRSEIIWHKLNPMPESIRDRPTVSHEKLFLLTKSERYFYDAEAIMEPSSPQSHARAARNRSDNHKWADGGPGNQSIAKGKPVAGRMLPAGVNPKAAEAPDGPRSKQNASWSEAVTDLVAMRNKRNVWSLTSESFSEAHFATFPTALVEPCILAGCPAGGLVLDPFGGAGTTGLVADRLGRDAILIELNPEYAEMARRRIHGDAPLFAQVEA